MVAIAIRTQLRRARSRRHADARRGVVLVAAMVSLAVVAIVLMGALRATVAEHRQLRRHLHKLQAEQLADAAVARCRAMLDKLPGYRGEVWRIPAEQLNGRDGGVVTIECAPVAGQQNALSINVQADFPDDPLRRARATRVVVVPTP